MNEFWTTQTCTVCDKPFATEEEYDDRHDDGEGGDCHVACCPVCISPFAMTLVTVGNTDVEADLGKLEVALMAIGNVPDYGPWVELYNFCQEIMTAARADRHDEAAELPVMAEEDFTPTGEDADE